VAAYFIETVKNHATSGAGTKKFFHVTVRIGKEFVGALDIEIEDSQT
jgi:hypothetical protein